MATQQIWRSHDAWSGRRVRGVAGRWLRASRKCRARNRASRFALFEAHRDPEAITVPLGDLAVDVAAGGAEHKRVRIAEGGFPHDVPAALAAHPGRAVG